MCVSHTVKRNNDNCWKTDDLKASAVGPTCSGADARAVIGGEQEPRMKRSSGGTEEKQCEITTQFHTDVLSTSKLSIKSRVNSWRETFLFHSTTVLGPTPFSVPDTRRLIVPCPSHCDGHGPSAPISLGGSFSRRCSPAKTSKGCFVFFII